VRHMTNLRYPGVIACAWNLLNDFTTGLSNRAMGLRDACPALGTWELKFLGHDTFGIVNISACLIAIS